MKTKKRGCGKTDKTGKTAKTSSIEGARVKRKIDGYLDSELELHRRYRGMPGQERDDLVEKLLRTNPLGYSQHPCIDKEYFHKNRQKCYAKIRHLKILDIIRFPDFNNFALICTNYHHDMIFKSMLSDSFKTISLGHPDEYEWRNYDGTPIQDFPYFITTKMPIVTFLKRYPQNIQDENDFKKKINQNC